MRAEISPRSVRLFLAGIVVVFASAALWSNTGSVQAGFGPDLESRYAQTPPTIDGILSAAEWGSPFAIILNGFNDPTKTRTAQLYVRNSGTDLYVAVFLSEPNASGGDTLELDFDTDHDGNATPGGEDALRYNNGTVDLYWQGADWAADSAQQGSAVRAAVSGGYTYEFSKPLNAGDSQDMSIPAGATIGFRIETWDADVSEYYRYPADTRGHGNVAVEWAKWANLRTAPSPIFTPPTLNDPAAGAQLSSLGATLAWSNPPGTTQYQIQISPYNNDGPGTNLIRIAESSYTVRPPAFGTSDANYVMLPGMTYTWRVRATSKETFAEENDPEWGPWSDARTFRTALRDSSRIALFSPTNGATVTTVPRAIQWGNGDTDVFYYEVQMSPDPRFGEAGAVASVWSNLVHAGVTNPPNSWTTPTLAFKTTYYWRVRPRIQGDGAPVAWSPSWSIKTE